MRTFLIIIGSILLMGVAAFGLTAFHYGSLIFLGPKYQNAHREIFENTKSFRDGSSRDLDNLRLSYLRAATPEEKAAIKDIMRHRALGVPKEQISSKVLTIILWGKIMRKILPILPMLFMCAACDAPAQSAEQQQKAQTKQLQDEAQRQIGMPAIVNFQERRMMKDLYEKRDSNISTQAYIISPMRGCLVYLGQAVGYGLPYATQFTNPSKFEYLGNYSGYNIAQPEPNGLYMPESAQGTWIMLLNPNTNQVEPVYIEPEVVVSPFRLINQECKN